MVQETLATFTASPQCFRIPNRKFFTPLQKFPP